MPEHTAIIAAARAYEFGPDQLRLTMFLTNTISEQIKTTFRFQSAVIGTPIQTFGSIALTLPPGFVFDNGILTSREGQEVPIRFLHIESTRIVANISGPSHHLDSLFEALGNILSSTTAPDGQPIMSAPQRVLDHSQVSTNLAFRPESLLAPALRAAVQACVTTSNAGNVLTPAIFMRGIATAATVEGLTVVDDYRAFRLEPRAGTRVDEQRYYCAAPLTTDAHLAYLTELERTLSQTG